ncbi:hypothetical protein WJ14_01715 [Burkholderia cenocepacia]|nr:hypothetical protein WJ14_01715 [Burkholderia cenocepacia]
MLGFVLFRSRGRSRRIEHARSGKLDALSVKRVEHAHSATLNTIDRTITETLLAHSRHNHGELNLIVQRSRVAHRCAHGTVWTFVAGNRSI